jgi:hypothetical protein
VCVWSHVFAKEQIDRRIERETEKDRIDK